MKRIVACIFCLLLVGCSATLPPPTNLAVLIALSSPTPTLISDYEPTWQPATITGKVVGVSDGDTITILDSGNRQHKIRLEGIDAPKPSVPKSHRRSWPSRTLMRATSSEIDI